MSEDNKKGFSGLGELLSDVQLDEIPSTEEKKAPDPEKSATQPSKSSPFGKNFFLFWGAIFLIWVIAQNSSSKNVSQNISSQKPSNYSNSIADTNSEEIPPVGTGLVLNHGQILYCLSEKVRLDGIEGNINKSADNDTCNVHNARIADYNSRCSSFRYPEGMLQTVQSQVDVNRNTLYLEGSEKLTLLRDAGIQQGQQSQNAQQTQNPYLNTSDQNSPTAIDSRLQDALAACQTAKDYQGALKIWRPLADQGNPIAQYSIGVLYEFGSGVPQNTVEAAKWYLKAANQEHAAAQWRLGIIYWQGSGVLEDRSAALTWWRKSAELGNADAQLAGPITTLTGMELV